MANAIQPFVGTLLWTQPIKGQWWLAALVSSLWTMSSTTGTMPMSWWLSMSLCELLFGVQYRVLIYAVTSQIYEIVVCH